MQKVRVGINGFGRIGRQVFRALHAKYQDTVEVVAINDLTSAKMLAHLLKYDSTQGNYVAQGHTVDFHEGEGEDNYIVVDGKKIVIYKMPNAADLPWGKLGVDVVLECTGFYTSKAKAMAHIEAGAKKVVISAPAGNDLPTVVFSVNENVLTKEDKVISAASCTTNCLAPAAKVINDTFGIRHGLMTTIHSYTMSQRILDGSHKDLRRARACAMSMIPTSTGAAKATALVIPALKGKLDGMAVRVPTPDISLVDLTCELEKPATAEEINAALKAAHDGALHDNMGYCDEPLVSIDFKGSTHGGVVDALSTQVMDGTMAKLIIWYDNESGFTNQLARLLRKVAASL